MGEGKASFPPLLHSLSFPTLFFYASKGVNFSPMCVVIAKKWGGGVEREHVDTQQ